jgi:hypothetical protein
MARAGMTEIIAALRGMTDAAADEYTVAGITYWSDDQLQELLDRCRHDYYSQPLSPAVENVGGAIVYQSYYWRGEQHVERLASGGAAWLLQNASGVEAGTADYTPYYDAGYVRFATDQVGAGWALTYRAYDLDRAASLVWERKAAHVASRFDLSTDNHDLKRSQMRQAYLHMAAHYRNQSSGAIGHTRLSRADLA